MKIKFFFLTCLLACFLCSYSQTCLSEGIEFSNQSQIENFPTSYPGWTQILGDVKIVGDNIVSSNESLTDLAGLSNLRTVGGLSISSSHLVVNLLDLSQLDSIGGNLGIHNMPFLNLGGLENLRNVDVSLGILDNPSLTSLSGLENLRHLERLEIKNTPSLASISAIDSAEFAAEFTGAWVKIQSNPLLSFCGAHSICKQMAIHWSWTVFSGNAEGCNS